MHKLRISVITVCYNAEATIGRCINSVLEQSYPNVEHIIIDGASTDGTMRVIERYRDSIAVIISEPDAGIYDAMNKGIGIATGDVVGMLNADDVFTDANVLTDVAGAFSNNEVDIIYGDLNYVKPDGKILRRWVSGQYKAGLFNRGWMPPHPTFYCRRELYLQHGLYSLNFGTAADYELMARFVHMKKVPVSYIPRVLINMFTGGVSNNGYKGRLKVLILDLKAMRKNGVKNPRLALLYKRLSKVGQFF